MGWGPVDWVGRVFPEAKFEKNGLCFLIFFVFEQPLLRYLLKSESVTDGRTDGLTNCRIDYNFFYKYKKLTTKTKFDFLTCRRNLDKRLISECNNSKYDTQNNNNNKNSLIT